MRRSWPENISTQSLSRRLCNFNYETKKCRQTLKLKREDVAWNNLGNRDTKRKSEWKLIDYESGCIIYIERFSSTSTSTDIYVQILTICALHDGIKVYS